MPYSGEHLNLIQSDIQPPENVIVTPSLARRWLATTNRNRSLSRQVVLTYLADMKRDQWVYTGDPLRFDVEGHLIDGQHRMAALAEMPENFALEFVVILGLPKDAQLSIDQGRKRTAGQQLDLHGYRHTNALAAGVRLLLSWEAERLFTRAWDEEFAITTNSISDWVHAHPEQVDVATNLYRHVRNIGMMPGVGIAFALRQGKEYPELVSEFFRDMEELVNQPAGSPLLAFTKRLNKARQERMKLDRIDQLGFLIITWNAWTDGRRLHKLIRPAGNEWTQDNFPRLDI
jgi:hypothetical protein